jgi:hypothetical protein
LLVKVWKFDGSDVSVNALGEVLDDGSLDVWENDHVLTPLIALAITP